jgi:hypothetical protein
MKQLISSYAFTSFLFDNTLLFGYLAKDICGLEISFFLGGNSVIKKSLNRPAPLNDVDQHDDNGNDKQDVDRVSQ